MALRHLFVIIREVVSLVHWRRHEVVLLAVVVAVVTVAVAVTGDAVWNRFVPPK